MDMHFYSFSWQVSKVIGHKLGRKRYTRRVACFAMVLVGERPPWQYCIDTAAVARTS